MTERILHNCRLALREEIGSTPNEIWMDVNDFFQPSWREYSDDTQTRPIGPKGIHSDFFIKKSLSQRYKICMRIVWGWAKPYLPFIQWGACLSRHFCHEYFSRGRVNLLVCHIFCFQVVFALLPLPNRLRLSCYLSDLVRMNHIKESIFSFVYLFFHYGQLPKFSF